jgi:hypothetical protein
MTSRPTPVPAVERLLRGVTGRCLCESVAVVPGFGLVVMPWHWNRFSGFPEPTSEQTLDELEAVVAFGNYRRFLADADQGRLVREVHRAGQHATWPAISDDAERSIEILRPVAEAVLDARGGRAFGVGRRWVGRIGLRVRCQALPTFRCRRARGSGVGEPERVMHRRGFRDALSGQAFIDLTPVGAETTWALTASNQRNEIQRVLRSTHPGGRWSDVTPPACDGPR